jgi:hypothetical protein
MKEGLEALAKFLNDATRPFVTNVVIAALSYGFITGTFSSEAYAGIAGLVIGYWFKQREEDKTGFKQLGGKK